MSEHCADCGKEIVPAGCGTGYGAVKEGGVEKKVCYDCCGVRDRNEMAATGRAVLYLTEKPMMAGCTVAMSVSNWPGTLVLPVRSYRRGSHNIAGSRVDVYFAGPDGAQWHGVQLGENSQICRCKRLKAA